MAVEWLALEIGADLISIDCEDLMDLALDFFHQEHRDWEEGQELPLEELPTAYFNTADAGNASTFRARKALAAIFDSPNIKRSATGESPSMNQNCPKLVILYLHNVASLYGARNGRKILVTLSQWVQNLQRKQPALLIGTAFAGEKGQRPNKSSMLGIRKSLSVHKNLDLDLDIPSSSKVKSPASGRRKLNLRRFRRTLLFRLGDSHTFNWTNPYSSWNCGSLQSNDLLEKEIFPDLLLKRAEMHVIEQMKMDANLDLDVICGIVSRVIDSYMFEKSPDTKFHSASDSKPNPSETRPDQPQSQAERDKSSPIEVPLDAIKLGCNEHEKRLLHTVVDPEELDVTFDDVTIDRDAKEIVKELFTLRKVLSSRGLKFIGSSGILLYGPPGTGKTHLSRAIAKDVGVNMLAITPADIESKWVGESQKAIGAAFSLARKLAPCVLFIEKVDALFGHRTSSSRRWEREAINQCLQEMDDIDTKHNSPLVVGATNRPLDLDEEFMRRLPHKVLFSLPTQHQRHEILQALVKQSDLDPSVSLEELSQTTAGYSRYDLKELCNQAVMISASEHFPNREDSKEDEDEKSTERLDNLILKPHHFAKALKRILSFFPDGATLETTGFAQKFNPNQGDGAGR